MNEKIKTKLDYAAYNSGTATFQIGLYTKKDVLNGLHFIDIEKHEVGITMSTDSNNNKKIKITFSEK